MFSVSFVSRVTQCGMRSEEGRGRTMGTQTRHNNNQNDDNNNNGGGDGDMTQTHDKGALESYQSSIGRHRTREGGGPKLIEFGAQLEQSSQTVEHAREQQQEQQARRICARLFASCITSRTVGSACGAQLNRQRGAAPDGSCSGSSSSSSCGPCCGPLRLTIETKEAKEFYWPRRASYFGLS